MTTFGPASGWFRGINGVAIASIFLVAAVALANRAPYRMQKIFILIFALAVAISGMYKFRAALDSQLSAQRYFYIGSVFSLWFICCISETRLLRTILAAFVAVTELLLLPAVAHTPRIAEDLDWPIWSRYIASGVPVVIPTSPPGFFLGFPPAADGPLARFVPWIGKDIAKVAGAAAPAACSGSMGPIEPLQMVNLQLYSVAKQFEKPWISRGWAWDAARNRPVQLVMLVDNDGRVVGFGLPGFTERDGTNGGPRTRTSGWTSIFYAHPEKKVRAYGIVDDGHRICPLANEYYFPLL
jgi:hypothetical protein